VKDAEILMLRHQLAVACASGEGSFTADVPAGVAGVARRDAAGRALGRVAADRDPGHDLAWHCDIVRRRWARLSRRGRSGRPPVRRSVRSVVLRLARGERVVGYRRVHGELAALGIRVRRRRCGRSSRTPDRPAPRRDALAAEFLRSQAQGSWRWTSSPLTCSMARRYTSLR